MRRYIVIKGNAQGNKRLLYSAFGIVPITQYRIVDNDLTGVGSNSMSNPVVYGDFAVFTFTSNITTPYVFVVDIRENQPLGEHVEELSSLGLTIEVYNENGVLVCDNGDPPGPGVNTPTIPSGPGEMTSEPIDGPGEML